MLRFPKSSCILWDGTSTGPPCFLNISYYRKPQLEISEKVLRLIYRQISQDKRKEKMLVASLSVEDDGEGVCFHIEGLDTRLPGSETSVMQGDIMVPVQVSNNAGQDRSVSVNDYVDAFQMLQSTCQSHESLELHSLLLLKGWFCFYVASPTGDDVVAHLYFDLVTLSTTFKVTPVNPVPIVPTALAKNLGGPRSISQVQGRPKMGYLTMDHTRKLLLALDSDPKVSSLPIVGIWVSGVSLVHHLFVWATCLRYLHNRHLQDRVCIPPEAFLLLLHSSVHSRPEFYEVTATSGNSKFEFDLFSSHEITKLNKKSACFEADVLRFELVPVVHGSKRESFDVAVREFPSTGKKGIDCHRNIFDQPISDDIEPRAIPEPHTAMEEEVRTMVPEVSVLWNDYQRVPGTENLSDRMSPPMPTSASFQLFPPGNGGLCCLRSPEFPSTDLQNVLISVSSVTSRAADGDRCVSGFCKSEKSSCHFNSDFAAWNCTKRGLDVSATDVSRCSLQPGSCFKGEQSFVSATTGAELLEYTSSSGSMVGCRPLLVRPHFTPSSSFGYVCPPVTAITLSRPQYEHDPQGAHSSQSTFTPIPHQSTCFTHCQIPCARLPLRHEDMTFQEIVAKSVPFCCPFISKASNSGLSDGVANIPPEHEQPGATFSSHSLFPQTQCNLSERCHQATATVTPVTRESEPCCSNMPLYPSSVEVDCHFHDAVIRPPTSTMPADHGVAPSTPIRDGKVVRVQEGPHCAARCASPFCSVRSNDDSGLSKTPDHPRCPNTLLATQPPRLAEVFPAGAGSLAQVNWAGVPGEVVQLLLNQNAQLQSLQAQVQLLLSSSDLPSIPAAVASRQTVSSDMAVVVGSVGEGTTVNVPVCELARCASVQTSPCKCPCRSHGCHGDAFADPISSAPTALTVSSSSQHSSFQHIAVTVTTSERQSPHRAVLSIGNYDGRIIAGDLANRTASDRQGHLSGIDLAPGKNRNSGDDGQLSVVCVEDCSEGDISWAKSCSPVLQSAEVTDEQQQQQELSPDSKEYYDQMINNIHLLLNSHKDEDGCKITDTLTIGGLPGVTLSGSPTCLQLFDSPGQLTSVSFPSPSNISSISKINYLSMKLSSDTPSNASLEINAMAMKYLRDDQLTHMAQLRQSPLHTHKHWNQAQFLQQVLAASMNGDGDSSNQSTLCPNDLSMASRRYMEKYGLSGWNRGDEDPAANTTLQLQTDFSLALLSEPLSSPQLPRSPLACFPCSSPHSPAKRSAPHRKRIPHICGADHCPGCGDNKYGMQCEASPGLPYHNRRHGNCTSSCSRGDTPSNRNQFFDSRRTVDHSNDYSTLSDEDRILDIERLRQLPKLL